MPRRLLALLSVALAMLTAAAAMSAGCVPESQPPTENPPPATPKAERIGSPAADRTRTPIGAPWPERVVDLGPSVEKRPILMHLLGGGPHPVLVLGGIHGSERNSAVCAQLFLSYARAHPAEFAGVPLAVIPEANPDGLARGVRFNARRVDLNRNFPAANWSRSYASGRSADSEPETAALEKIIREQQPRRILSIHSITAEPCNNFDGPAEPLARAMASKNGYAVKDAIGYPTPGSLGNWAGHDLGIPVVTLELPAAMPGAECWDHNRAAIVEFARMP
jgi:murein peptide amidase A